MLCATWWLKFLNASFFLLYHCYKICIYYVVEDAVAADDDSDDERSETQYQGTEEDILANMDNHKERFYVKDPHKALKHFFEKEGNFITNKLLVTIHSVFIYYYLLE